MSPLGAAAARLAPTPAQSEGPFYPDRLPLDRDADLVRVAGRVREAGGEVLELTGRVLDPDSRPASGAAVEIWQCDAGGRYLHSGDLGGPRDDDFQGYGRTAADAEGRYRFRTIRPVPYTGRTPHIHFKVHHPGGRALTTQMYVAGEPRNAGDGLYRRLDPAERERVTVALARPPAGVAAAWIGAFEIVLPWPVG